MINIDWFTARKFIECYSQISFLRTFTTEVKYHPFTGKTLMRPHTSLFLTFPQRKTCVVSALTIASHYQFDSKRWETLETLKFIFCPSIEIAKSEY